MSTRPIPLPSALSTGMYARPVVLYDKDGNEISFSGGLGVNTELSAARLAADGLSLPTTAEVIAILTSHNGATQDLWRGNLEGTLLASGARTADTASADQTNYNARGALFFFNVTVAGGGTGFRLIVQGKDPISGSYQGLQQYPSSAITSATGLYCMLFYPGAATTGLLNTLASQALPRTWRVLVDHTDATSHTYSVGYSLIL